MHLMVAALILRQRGQVQGSLEHFQKALQLNPHNANNLKQIARSLYVWVYVGRSSVCMFCCISPDRGFVSRLTVFRFLLSRHRAAIDIYNELIHAGVADWVC